MSIIRERKIVVEMSVNKVYRFSKSYTHVNENDVLEARCLVVVKQVQSEGMKKIVHDIVVPVHRYRAIDDLYLPIKKELLDNGSIKFTVDLTKEEFERLRELDNLFEFDDTVFNDRAVKL